MSDDSHGKVKLELLKCRRTGQMFSSAEHERCPYCSADAATIERSGNYLEFCEYEAGVDPVNFGFPGDTSRNRTG